MRLPTNDESFDDDDTGALVPGNDQPERKRPNPIVNCIFTGIAYVQFFWIYHRTEFILGMILFCSVSLAVTGVIEAFEHRHENANHKHTVRYDYSDIKSALELKLGNIDHWCLDGGEKHCPKCEDPTEAISRTEIKWWGKTFMRNVMLSQNYMTNHQSIDVIFLGDSNTEARAGTLKGQNGSISAEKTKEGPVKRSKLEDTLYRSQRKFEKYFNKASESLYNGLALGIAGDTSPNLLWRIQNNEMSDLKPRVWWISIGVNDMLVSNCSEEITIMGILRVVEELLLRNDGSTIVINSLLPVATRSSLPLEGPHLRNKYWSSIKFVNERLARFAKKHKGVKFFDATGILTEYRGHNRYMKKELFMDTLHLSVEGQETLAKAQASFMASLLEGKENDILPEDRSNLNPNVEEEVVGTNETDSYYDYDDLFRI